MADHLKPRTLLALITVGACTHQERVSPTAPGDLNRAAAVRTVASLHARTASERLAASLPEFGGAFIDPQGTLNVYLTDDSAIARARSVVGAQLSGQGRGTMPVRFVHGHYSYTELTQIIEKLLPYLGPPGIAYFGVDEWHHRVQIGIVTEEARVRVMSAIKQLSLPKGAIALEKASYAIPLSQHQPTDALRPPLYRFKLV